jgi:hypothetical protein
LVAASGHYPFALALGIDVRQHPVQQAVISSAWATDARRSLVRSQASGTLDSRQCRLPQFNRNVSQFNRHFA